MATDHRQILGRAGERLALEHYERLGFHVLERNYRTPAGELDLIVYDGTTIVFVEVKTRRDGGLDPIDAVTPAKQRRLRRLAAGWLADRGDRPRGRELRFDAVAVVIDVRGRLIALDHWEAIM
ncbi:MAG: YraN family protein [Solirubrobacteraceae bacterium]